MVNLSGGGLSGGYKKILREIIPLIRKDEQITNLAVFVPPQVKASDIGFAEGEPLGTWPEMDVYSGYSRLKRAVIDSRPDVIFMATARWIGAGKLPVVVMVQNMEPMVAPFGGNSAGDCLRNIVKARLAKRACVAANRVIAPSRHVKDFLVERWGLPTDKISVVYNGLGPPVQRSDSEKPPILEERQDRRFVFTAGSIRPARGLSDIIRGFSFLRSERRELDLIIAGGVSPRAEAHAACLRQQVDDAGLGGRVVWTGHLSERQMSWCYYNCSAFVMTSRAETCPYIALEAMAHGCLILSTTQEPMPEVFDRAAIYYQPHEPQDLAKNLQLLLDMNPEVQKEYRIAATARATEFRWEDMARGIISVLRSVAVTDATHLLR